ncbi:MAG TPA: glycosyltransferase family 4 protein [Candidatus Saccharimonadales bacterium]|nr:glycosyltransferase family 4 protein [Candidatus Saccharimonadales bacterium]
MKIAIVGPTHPYKGGIAQHTTELAHHLKAAGHHVELISWSRQYPFFYPGVQFVDENKPEVPVFKEAKRVLSWRNPAGWARWARRLRNFDEVIFIWFVPTIQGPVALTMMQALGKHGPKKIILAHNMVSHSASGPDKKLAKLAFSRADEVLVHTDAMAERVHELAKANVKVAAMPAHLPGGVPKTTHHLGKLHRHLLFFGLVRKYKGVDILLQALAKVPDIKLTVAGEMWGKQKANLEALVQELGLSDRVELKAGYVAAEDIAGLFATADGLVLPYRSGTATQNVELAFAHGLPVIATAVGSMPSQVRQGVDGLICEPENPDQLAKAIEEFYLPGVANHLASNVPKVSSEKDWDNYVATLTS